MFRRFLKKNALKLNDYNRIRHKPLDRQGLAFARALKLPNSIALSVRNQLALLIMINSHRIMWRKRLVPGIREMMLPYEADLWPTFFRIFNETNCRFRLKFFQEPVIKLLWPRFTEQEGPQIAEYVRQVHLDYVTTPQTFSAWLQEVRTTENAT
jgi:hypothetical protein